MWQCSAGNVVCVAMWFLECYLCGSAVQGMLFVWQCGSLNAICVVVQCRECCLCGNVVL